MVRIRARSPAAILIVCILGGVALAQTPPMPACSPSSQVAPPGPAGPVPTVPAGPIAFDVVAQYGGRPRAVAVRGDRAYAAVGNKLVVLDISNPASLVPIGVSETLPANVLDVAVAANVAYVAIAERGLAVLEVSNPAVPRLIGHLDTPGHAEAISVAGNVAYVADGPAGLRIVDVSDPARPRETGSAFTRHIVLGLAIEQRRAYLAAAGAGLLIVDVANPSAPVELGRATSSGFAWSVAVDGSIAWVADAWSGVTAFDVRDVWRPAVIGSHATSGWSMDVDVDGELLTSASADGGVDFIDASIPARPRTIGTVRAVDGHAHRLARIGTTVFVADRNQGILAIDGAAPAAPVERGRWTPLGFADDVSIAGNLAWVAADSFGVGAIDLVTGRDVVRLPIPEHSFAKNVTSSGAFVFVTPQFSSALGVVDATDPAKATLTWHSWPFGSARNHALSGGLLVIPMEWGLRIINVSDPRAPCELNFMNFTGTGPSSPGPSTGPVATGIALSGNYAFVAASSHGMWVVDLSDPRTPAKVTALPDFMDGQSLAYEDLARFGSFVYVYGRSHLRAYIRVIDVSDPLRPRQRGVVEIPQGVQGWGPFLAATATTVFVADRTPGLLAIDVRDPDKPVLAGRQALPAPASAVVLHGDLIYVAADDAGLFVLRPRAVTAAPALEFVHRSAARRRPRTPPAPEPDEDAQSPISVRAGATCVVTSTADSGSGTLRECITGASAGSSITFDPLTFPPAQPATIKPLTALPQISAGAVVIDGSNAGVILDGSAAPAATNGLTIRSDGNRISGLQILRFGGDGIAIRGRRNTIGGDRSRGAGPSGEGNVISGNGVFGIRVNSRLDERAGNRIVGNLIGVDVTGRVAMGNALEGINLLCDGNTVGGTTAADRNVISGSGETDMHVSRDHNMVIGNYIGTDITGMVRLSNVGYWSVSLEGGASSNIIQANVVAGGLQTGIAMTDAGTSYNQAIGNLVGLNASGTEALSPGIISSDEAFNRIDGNTSSATIDLWNRATMNVIRGNRVATDANGTRGIGAGPVGIYIDTRHNYIGGAAEGEGNLVAGRIRLEPGSAFNVIAGNAVATDFGATQPVTGQFFVWPGIELNAADENAVQDNVVGFRPGLSAIRLAEGATGNLLRGNRVVSSGTGIEIAASNGNRVYGNALLQNGTNASDTGTNNAWDDGSRGNFWSDHSSQTPRAVPPNGVDRHPVMSSVLRNPVPSVSGTEPAAVASGANTFTLVVRGDAFAPGATVLWEGIPLATTFESPTRLRAEVPAARLASPARVRIVVVNPSPGGGVASETIFAVSAPPRRRTARP